MLEARCSRARSSLLELEVLDRARALSGLCPGAGRGLASRSFRGLSGVIFTQRGRLMVFTGFPTPPKRAAALFGWFSLVFRCSPKQPPKSCWFSLVFQNCSREQPPCRENQKTRDCFVVFRPRPLRKNQNRKTRKPMNKSGSLPD